MNGQVLKAIGDAMDRRNAHELAIGFVRYEALRKLNARQFAELCERNLRERIAFDDLVDELVTKGTSC